MCIRDSIKAALGGGGKGMRVANTPEEFPEAYATARKESEIAFGDGTMYIEHFEMCIRDRVHYKHQLQIPV